MASSKWKSFGEINKILAGRDFVFWGASNWITPTIHRLEKNPQYILDTNPNNDGVVFEGYNVIKPTFGKLKKDKVFIIISTGNYDTLCQELQVQGFEMGSDFCVSPLLEDRSKKDRLLEFKGKALFCSPQHFFEKDCGGGLYEMDLFTGKQKKVYSGKCRTVVRYKSGYAIVDMLSGVKILNNSYKVIDEIELPANSEPHGLFYDEPNDVFYIGCPGNDCVYSINSQSKIIDEYRITNKYIRKRADFHHINDVYVCDGSLFVSMFSISGNWPNDSYDGGLLEFDISTGHLIGPVWQNLWMPHSITKYQNTLALLDSMTGRLLTANKSVELELPGFLRGLDFKENFAVIAVSAHRYPEKVKTKKYPIMMNAQIYLVDLETNMAKSMNVVGTETIHSLIFI